jgi:phosphatidylglycerol---prolipoprotein diacylglyceryl transferase
MFPVLFRIGSFEITSFGAMVALGAALGILLLRRELQRSGVDLAKGTDTALVGVLGGLAGAKLLYVIEHWAEPFSETLLSRGGMSWFGGLTGGLIAGLAMIAWQRLPLMTVLAAAAPAMTLGQAVGRIGCFLVGDDYGRPTSLPWGLAFPEGLPPTTERVHPAQLYEAAILFPMTWLLLRMRAGGMADRAVFGWYLVIAGGVRFLIELVRVNVRVAVGLSTAQFFSIGAVILGLALVLTAGKETREPLAQGSRLKAQGLSGSRPGAKRPKP